ncbi:MAG TPA: DUF882 domain-containing protein, partial [Dissulfurispiraceae bacterium]|nr:DUF882 domain-containing protein [Dissulfurispiraceae bacterium]
TGEHLVVPYFACGAYDTQALYEINRLLRCHFTDEVIPIDVGLVDLLHEVTTLVGGTNPVHIVSGYRSPAYNTYLKSLGRKVARSSLHLQGQAVDFSIPDVLPKQLARAARSLAAGGVGEYRNFVHIDIGRIRYW